MTWDQQKPYGWWDRTYRYPEGRGVFTEAVARYLRESTLMLLPVKAKSFKLLESAGVVGEGLQGWPQEFTIDYGLPEGFFKVRHPWAFTVNPNDPSPTATVHKFYDPVYSGGLMPPRPDIEHVYEDTVRYDFAEFGVRFAMNLYDRYRIGPAKWNQRMKEMMRRRIDAYALQLNQMIWDYRKVAYFSDHGSSCTHPYVPDTFETLGSIPFYLNGLICRFGVLRKGPNAATRPASEAELRDLPIVALTFHDGNIDPNRVPPPLQVGTDAYIHWSVLPIFFHKDLYKNGGAQFLFARDLDTQNPLDEAYYLKRHVVGDHPRGYKETVTAWQLFNGFVPNSPTQPVDDLEGVYWQLFTPALLSAQWNTAYSGPVTHIVPGDKRRVLEVYRRTKMPTVYASRVSVVFSPSETLTVSYQGYPIYGFDNPTAPSPSATRLGWTLFGVDTRAPVTAVALEYVYYAISENSGDTPPRLLITRPEIHSSLNVMSITTPTYWKDANSTKVHNTQFGGEFSRYKDAVVVHDLQCPRGVIFVGTLSKDTLRFDFDKRNFEVERVPLPNAVHYFQGFFTMKMMLINPQPWGMLWGVREASAASFLQS